MSDRDRLRELCLEIETLMSKMHSTLQTTKETLPVSGVEYWLDEIYKELSEIKVELTE